MSFGNRANKLLNALHGSIEVHTKYMAESTVWDSFAGQVVDAFSIPRLNGLPRINSVADVSVGSLSPVNLSLLYKRGFIKAKAEIGMDNALPCAVYYLFSARFLFEETETVSIAKR